MHSVVKEKHNWRAMATWLVSDSPLVYRKRLLISILTPLISRLLRHTAERVLIKNNIFCKNRSKKPCQTPMIRVNLSPVSACSATNLWQEGNDGVGTIIIAKTTTKNYFTQGSPSGRIDKVASLSTGRQTSYQWCSQVCAYNKTHAV